MAEEVKKNNRKNYDRDVVIRKLEGKGLKAIYKVIDMNGHKVKTSELLYLESKTPDYNLGIKMLGMVDFLGVPIVCKKKTDKAIGKLFKAVAELTEEVVVKKPSSLVRRRKEQEGNEN